MSMPLSCLLPSTGPYKFAMRPLGATTDWNFNAWYLLWPLYKTLWCTLKFLIVGGGVKLPFIGNFAYLFPFINTPPNYVFHAKSHTPHFIGDPHILEKQR